MNVRRRRIAGWHSYMMFAIQFRELDVFHQVFQDVWGKCKCTRAMDIPKPLGFSYMTDKAQSGTGLKRDLIQKVAEAEYHVMSLGAFLHCARYGLVERLS